MTAGELRDLTDEQCAVSGAAARLAAARASTVSVRRLLTLVDQLAGAATPGARIMADSRFHIEVAIASESERLTTLEVALQAKLAELLWLPVKADRRPATASSRLRPSPRIPCRRPVTAAAEHAAIAAAIEAEDGSRARVLAEGHVEATSAASPRSGSGCRPSHDGRKRGTGRAEALFEREWTVVYARMHPDVHAVHDDAAAPPMGRAACCYQGAWGAGADGKRQEARTDHVDGVDEQRRQEAAGNGGWGGVGLKGTRPRLGSHGRASGSCGMFGETSRIRTIK